MQVCNLVVRSAFSTISSLFSETQNHKDLSPFPTKYLILNHKSWPLNADHNGVVQRYLKYLARRVLCPVSLDIPFQTILPDG